MQMDIYFFDVKNEWAELIYTGYDNARFANY
jgi:hypothetical protein